MIGGIELTPHEMPWLVAVLDGATVVGAGTILTERWVLTSAHCVANRAAYGLSIRAGAHDLAAVGDREQTAGVDAVTAHPGFDRSRVPGDHDIALLRLTTPLTFDEAVGPATLPPSAAYSPKPGTKLSAAGWNPVLGASGLPPHKAIDHVLPLEDAAATGWFERTTPLMLFGEKASPSGIDAGGPVLVHDGAHMYLGGVIIPTQPDAGLPSTAVARYTDFINRVMAQE